MQENEDKIKKDVTAHVVIERVFNVMKYAKHEYDNKCVKWRKIQLQSAQIKKIYLNLCSDILKSLMQYYKEFLTLKVHCEILKKFCIKFHILKVNKVVTRYKL